MAAGEVTWVGVEQIGDRNGRVALYLTESLPLLRLPDLICQLHGEQSRPTSPILSAREKIPNSWPVRAPLFFLQFMRACGRRFSGRHRRRLVGTGLGRPNHQRHFLSVAQIAAPR